MRDNSYTIESRIRFSEIDHTRKVTLPAIINYFQDCSIFQSEEIGYGFSYLDEHRKAWVLSSWQIDIKRYPVLGEKIKVSTWATGFKGILGERNFCMRDEADRIVACANSLWVYNRYIFSGGKGKTNKAGCPGDRGIWGIKTS